MRTLKRNTSQAVEPLFSIRTLKGRSKKRRDDGTDDGTLTARGSASRYMDRRKATRQATELTTV